MIIRKLFDIIDISNYGNSDKQEGLLRLFQSSIFDMDLAIQYLSKYTDYGIQAFLGTTLEIISFYHILLS